MTTGRDKLFTVFLRSDSEQMPAKNAPSSFGFALEGDGPCRLRVPAGGLAHRSGLRSGDALVAVDGQCVEGKRHMSVAHRLRKAVHGSQELLLTVRRPFSSMFSSPHSSNASSTHSSRRRLFQKRAIGKYQRRSSTCATPPPLLRRKVKVPSPPLTSPSVSADSLSPVHSSSGCSSPSSTCSSSADVQQIGTASTGVAVAQFVLRFLGQFRPFAQCEDKALVVDKGVLALREAGSPAVAQRPQGQGEMCLLSVHEDKLLLQLTTSTGCPFDVSPVVLPTGAIKAAVRSRVDPDVFGVLADGGAQAQSGEVCLLFRILARELLAHSAHAPIARAMHIRCRMQSAHFEPSAQCAQFPACCAHVVASIRFCVPPPTPKRAQSTGEEHQNAAVAEFMRKLAETLTQQIDLGQAEETTAADTSTDSLSTQIGGTTPDRDGTRIGWRQSEARAEGQRLAPPIPFPRTRLQQPPQQMAMAPPPLPPRRRLFKADHQPQLDAHCAAAAAEAAHTEEPKRAAAAAEQTREVAPQQRHPPAEHTQSSSAKRGGREHCVAAPATPPPIDEYDESAQRSGRRVAADGKLKQQCPPLDDGSVAALVGPKRHWADKENLRPSAPEAAKEAQEEKRARQQAPAGAAMPAGGGATSSPQHARDDNAAIGAGVDLEQVLKSESARAPFHQFLQQQFCAENINFYLAVEEYKKIPEHEADRRTDFGRQIYDRHFAANCIEPVNIDNCTSNQIREAYKCNRFTQDVYDVVQYQIFHLLKYDCWPRYLRSGGALAEELCGDAKSHDSGASTSRNAEQCVVASHRSSGNTQNSRRKSLFRFLRRQQRASEEGCADAEADHCTQCCECCAEAAAASSLGAAVAATLNGGGGDEPRQPSSPRGKTRRKRESLRRQCTCRCSACGGGKEFGESKTDFPLRYCTLLCADSATSTEISLGDPFQSVKQWTNVMADQCGLDKQSCEVVDAQTGSTIDPVRQAVDALNNRVVRIIPVVKFPVVFLAPSPAGCASGGGAASKPCAPLPAKAVVLRCRPALTVGKVLRPIMAKYNVDTEQAVVCIAGTCEVLKLQTPVSAIYLKTLAVMSQQQLAERKVLPKREYQKELTLVPPWMTSSGGTSSSAGGGQSSPGPDSQHHPPFHQHGDVGFCELALEPEGGKGLVGGLGSGLLKHSASRSYSSNPREFFKFGRKPTAKARPGTDQQHQADLVNSAGVSGHQGGGADSGQQNQQLRYRKSGGSSMGRNSQGAAKEADRRKSLGAAASAAAAAAAEEQSQGSGGGPSTSSGAGGPRMSSAALAVGLVAPSDIPYCGEMEDSGDEPVALHEVHRTYTVPRTVTRREPVFVTKSAVYTTTTTTTTTTSGSQDETRQQQCSSSGANGQSSPPVASAHLPAIYSTALRSDKDVGAGGAGISPSQSAEGGAMVWQQADYV